MKTITVVVFAIVVLIGIVSSAEIPQIVYIHYSTPEEAEEARQKILAEFEGATIIMADDPTLALANITAASNAPESSLDKVEESKVDTATDIADADSKTSSTASPPTITTTTPSTTSTAAAPASSTTTEEAIKSKE